MWHTTPFLFFPQNPGAFHRCHAPPWARPPRWESACPCWWPSSCCWPPPAIGGPPRWVWCVGSPRSPRGHWDWGLGSFRFTDFLRIFTNIVSLVFLGHLLGMKPEHLQLFFGYFSLTNAHGVLTFGALLEFWRTHTRKRFPCYLSCMVVDFRWVGVWRQLVNFFQP